MDAPDRDVSPPASPPPRAPFAPLPPGGWLRWLPGLRTLKDYRAEWLPHDLVAGLVLTAMLVPVGIAYAEASGVPGIYGLYATIVPLLAYALFGPSRILVLGPDSSLAALILAVVLPLSGGDPVRAIVVASMMAVVAGIVCILAGVLRLGFVTELLSKPIRHGYMNGIALTVLISQLPKLAGVSVDAEGPGQALWQFAQAMLDGRWHGPTLALGAGALVLILALRRFERVPGILVAVVLATVAVARLDLDADGVAVMGEVPQGLPAFAVPWLSGVDLVHIVMGGVAVALVSFADTSVLSRTYAARLRTPVDPNQEMVGLGAANLAAGFFQGFPISSSSSRTPVAEAAGAKTQLTGVVGALGVAGLLLLAPDLMHDLPTTALAAVVIASALGLFEFADLRRIRRMQAWEFWLSMGCFAGVVLLGPIPGIGLAVVLAVIEFLWDGWRPHFAVLGRVDGLRGYHDVARYPHARRVPGLLLFRWDAPLFFANAEWFQQSVLRAVDAAPDRVRRVVVAAEPVTSIDVTSADMLRDLAATLRAAGVELHFAEMKDPVKDKIRQFELTNEFPPDRFHPTVGAAVDDYLADHGVAWTP
jgi:high affinity sulfate transporter 1